MYTCSSTNGVECREKDVIEGCSLMCIWRSRLKVAYETLNFVFPVFWMLDSPTYSIFVIFV